MGGTGGTGGTGSIGGATGIGGTGGIGGAGGIGGVGSIGGASGSGGIGGGLAGGNGANGAVGVGGSTGGTGGQLLYSKILAITTFCKVIFKQEKRKPKLAFNPAGGIGERIFICWLSLTVLLKWHKYSLQDRAGLKDGKIMWALIKTLSQFRDYVMLQ